MSVTSRKIKTYGVLQTEYCFYFYGFSKKINSEEIQKVDIFLDDKLIDTITANLHVKEIDEKYDIDEFSFTYKLPEKYIGEKHTISFRNHFDGEELENSPYELIDKNNPKFNEYKNHPKFNEHLFLNSLEDINTYDLKNVYNSNYIGFLATNDNLNDSEFLGYLNELTTKESNLKVKGFYYTNNEPLLDSKISNLSIEFIQINSIKDLLNEIEIYVHNKNKLYLNLVPYIRKYSTDVYSYYFDKNYLKNTLKQADEKILKMNINYLTDPQKFGFETHENSLAKISPHQFIMYHIMNKIGNKQYELDLNLNQYEFAQFIIINYILNIKNFKNEYLEFLNKTEI